MGNGRKIKAKCLFTSFPKQKMQITDNDIIGINEVRDLIYDENTNQIILFKSTSSIGVIRKIVIITKYFLQFSQFFIMINCFF